MKNLKKLTLAAGATLLLSTNAQAAVVTKTLTFDDLAVKPTGSNYVTLGVYGGLDWKKTGVINSSEYTPYSGYNNANVSGSYIAFNKFAEQATTVSFDIVGNKFNFLSAYFTAAWRDDLQLVVQGFKADGSGTVSKTIYLDSDNEDLDLGDPNAGHGSKLFVEFSDFTDINKLTFTSSGGEHNDVFGAEDAAKGIGGAHFAMDNFKYSYETPTPEPSTMLLGLMGLGSALGFRRKKA